METLFRLLANRTVKEKSELSLCQAPLSMGFTGKNTGLGCHALLQGIFPTQGMPPALAGKFFTTSNNGQRSLVGYSSWGRSVGHN